MKTILLTRGQITTVDDCDFEYLSRWKWYAMKAGRFGFYAARSTLRSVRPRGTVLMHRVVLERKLGDTFGDLEADHKSGNKLDNRRENILPATSRENKQRFKRKSPGKTSRFRGVFWNAKDCAWQASLKHHGKRVYTGNFQTEEEAAKARDTKAREFFGELAHLNNVM